MKRLHLFEFIDQEWFPKFLRDYETDYLQFIANSFNFYKGILPVLKKGIENSGQDTIIDLGAGGGGGWLKIAPQLKEEIPDLEIVLTDYFPNIDAFQSTIKQAPDTFSFQETSINAMDVPKDLKGFRTLFLTFHHFKPEEAQQILANAVENKAPIAIFEAQQRTFSYLLQFAFSPIFVLLTSLLIKPFKLGRIFFTYLIPIIPLIVLFDGLVSVLRTHSPKELTAMTDAIENSDTYNWEIGEAKSGQTTIFYLLGTVK